MFWFEPQYRAFSWIQSPLGFAQFHSPSAFGENAIETTPIASLINRVDAVRQREDTLFVR
jgi:hypothetical protein